MGLNTQTENKFTGARNAGFSFSCFTAQRLFVINSFMMFVQHGHPVCSASTFLLGDGRLLSLLTQNWTSQMIRQEDRRSIFQHGPFREARQAAGITFLGFLGTQLPHVLQRRWDHPYYLSCWRRKTVRWLSEENPGQQSLGPATGAVPLLPKCHMALGTAPPVLECTVASTVGEISELETHHLVFPTNTEHPNRIHTATVQEPQTIPRAACLGSFPTPRQRLPNSFLSHTRIKPERPMSLTEFFLISTSTSENKSGAQVSSITDWQDHLTLHLNNRKCTGSRALLCFTGL